MNHTRILTIKFNEKITEKEITLFRGAVINALNQNNRSNFLFHNHHDNGFRYAYPLIQYKRINGFASIVCLNEGVDAIGSFFSSGTHQLLIGKKMMEMTVDSLKAKQHLIQIWDVMFRYRIRKWLPLNRENYQLYMDLEGISEKSFFLEKILIGNILSTSKGLNIHLDKEVKCIITALSEPFSISNKGVKLIAFDIEFNCNVSFPDFIGIGKSSSIGYGVLTNIHKNHVNDTHIQEEKKKLHRENIHKNFEQK